MNRLASILCALALGCLFAVAGWFRVTSLESMPYPDGDEAWYAVQVHHALTGQPFELFTPYANPVNPFFSGMHIPTLLTARPALWQLRIPAVVCGILAVVLTYVLGRRILDRTTATIASALLAVLPIAIIFSRIGFDACQTPLFTLLAIYCAFRADRVGLVLAFLGSYLVHPTNVFLLPVLLAVFLVQEAKKSAGDWARFRRVAIASMIVPTAFALAAGAITLRRPELQEFYRAGPKPTLGNHDPILFLTAFRRLFLGLSIDAPAEVVRRNNWLFWTPFFAVLVLGTTILVRRRQWDRVALVVGLFASAGGFFVVAGSDMIRPQWVSWLRYGLFLVVPAVLALACAARALLVEPTTAGRALARHLQHAGLLAVGAAMLCCVKANWFDLYTADRSESLWTPRADTKDRFQQAISTIRRDISRDGPRPGPRTIVAENHWVQRPLQYLAIPNREVQVVPYDIWEGTDRAHHQQLLKDSLRDGSYVVCQLGAPLEADVKASYPAEKFDRWDIDMKGRREIAVYHLKRGALGAPAAVGAAGPPAIRR